jgi:phage gp36-like protein
MYCTQTDITSSGLSEATLIQLTDDDADGVADAAVIAETIAQADSEINGYLGSRYSIPVSPVPALLRNLSVALSVWKLYSHRGLYNERRRKDYEDAIATCRRLAKGEMVLPDVTSGEVATDGSDLPEASRSAEDRTFTLGRPSTGERGTLDNF